MDNLDKLKPTQMASLLALFASSGTLICCALPALLVAVGAGAALSADRNGAAADLVFRT